MNPQPTPAVEPNPKRRSGKRKRIVSAVLAVVVLLLIAVAVASALSGGDNDSTASKMPHASNDAVEIQVLEVRSTDNPETAPLNILSSPDYGKHFVFVNMSVTNKGSSPERYGPNMFHLFVGENSVDELKHEVPALGKTDYKTPVGVEIIPTAQPGETVEFWVPYEVEDGMEIQKLLYYNDQEDSLTLLFER